GGGNEHARSGGPAEATPTTPGGAPPQCVGAQWQASGDKASNWTRFVRGRWPLRWLGVKAVRGKFNNYDKNNGFWDKYEQDIKLAADLNCTTFRFSIEWARIEPEPGVIDMEAVRRYHQMLDCMASHGLEPNATLWHFVHPLWFEDAGGFTREENIPAFVAFCKRCFGWFGSKIRLWATINEPTCYLFLGWIVGMSPPCHFMDLLGGGRMLSTMLKAHVAAYHAIKAMPGGDRAQIGLVNHHITFEAQGTGLLYGVAKEVAEWMTYWVGCNVMEHWMLTGEYMWRIPLLGVGRRWRDPAGRPPCDWWGINYYSRGVVSWHLTPTHKAQEVMTDMPYPLYAAGLYDAIKRCSQLGLPMYITETGIADARDDRRARMINKYFEQVLRAVADGYDVRGVYYWTLLDSMEWATGYTMKFGLYAWEPDGSVDRKLKEGSSALVRLYRELPDEMSELRKVAVRHMLARRSGDGTTEPVAAG
ncbi:Beta-glucosidase A, partial [Tetrabaena socialis]